MTSVRRPTALFTILVAVLALLLVLVVYGWPLFVRPSLSSLPGGYSVTARDLGGPIWSPRLRGAVVRGPGLKGEANDLRLRVRGVDLVRREVRLSGVIDGAEIDLDTREVFGGDRRSAWRVLPEDFTLRGVKVNLNNRGYDLPDAEVSATGRDGRLAVSARTRFGGAEADFRYFRQDEGLGGTADVEIDASVLNAFWDGVRGGVFRGRYTFEAGDLRGDLNLVGGRLVVPEATFVDVRDITGTVRHRGDTFDIGLRGRGLDGPVTATARVDTAARRWTARANATPSVSGLARAFGTTGTGTLRLSATAEGWDDPAVRVNVGGAGRVAGVEFRDLVGRSTVDGRRTRITLSAGTALANDAQRLAADLTVVPGERGERPAISGTARLSGRLLDAPLDLNARADGTRITASGPALGGRVTAAFDIATRALSADVDARTDLGRLTATADGTPEDVRVNVTRLAAGPLNLSGTGRLTPQGARVDLRGEGGAATEAGIAVGRVSLDVDPRGRGTWAVSEVVTAGGRVSGSGAVDLTAGRLQGRLEPFAPLVRSDLAGDVTLNWRERRAAYTFGAGRLNWDGRDVTARVRDLDVAGFALRGDLRWGPGGLTGTANAAGDAGVLDLRGEGRRVTYTARARGLTARGETSLSDDFATTLALDGAEVRGSARVRNGAASFDVRTRGETLRGTFAGGRLLARGAVDLRALRDLAGVPDLTGRADVNFGGERGTAVVRATARGASVSGTFAGTPERITGTVRGASGEIRARLTGEVFPGVDLGGVVGWRDQSVAARLSGEYGRLSWTASGRSAPLTVAGVTLPAQPLSASGTVTPDLRAQGRFGDLDLDFRAGAVTVRGTQTLTLGGETGRVRVNGTLGPDFAGRVEASGQLGAYTANVAGPWRDLRFSARAPGLVGAQGLRAEGRLNARTRAYDARVRGRAGGLFVDARVRGTDATFRASGTASDPSGGTARFTATSPTEFRVRASDLNVGGLRLNGDLGADRTGVSGRLQAGDLTLDAVRGRLRIAGTFAGTRVNGTARLTLPATVTDADLTASGEWGSLRLRGRGDDLRGVARVAPQQLSVVGAALELGAATLPARGSLVPPRVTVGGLTTDGTTFSGTAALPYRLDGRAGRVSLVGSGRTLTARLAGPASGSLRVLPDLAGDVSVDLAPFARSLPPGVRAELKPGRARARVSGRVADVTLQGTRYVGSPVTLAARVDASGTVRASGTLRHPGTRVNFDWRDGDLRVTDSRVDALAAAPLLTAELRSDLRGAVQGDVTLPDLDPQAVSADLRVALEQGRRTPNRANVAGTVRVRGGQVSADLRGRAQGQDVRVTGNLLPRADARVSGAGLAGTLSGDLRREVVVALSGVLNAPGGRRLPSTLDARVSFDAVTANARVGGAELSARASRGAGGWRASGRLDVPDLRTLADVDGNVSGVVDGPLTDLGGVLRGRVAQAEFTAPVRLAGGSLRLSGGTVRARQGEATLSGRLTPTLDLTGRAVVTQLARGQYDLRVLGTTARPDVRLSGRLGRDVETGPVRIGLSGTRLGARLLGRDWRVTADGEKLSGVVRGTLAAGLQDARVTTDAVVTWPDGDVRVRGPVSWNARTGFGGAFAVTGRASGQAVDLRAQGGLGADAGRLALSGTVARGRVRADLPATIARAPGGTLTLDAFDAGVLWNRAGEVDVTGRATLGGTWNAPTVSAAGRVADRRGEFSGPFSLSFAEGNVRADVRTPALTADVALAGGEYRANVTARNVRPERLLPERLLSGRGGVDDLIVSGRAEVQGSTRTLRRIVARDLDVRGSRRDVGAFSAVGSVTYTPETLAGDLSLRGLGGTGTLRGALPDGVVLDVRNVKQEAVGELSGRVTLRGSVRDPSVTGELTSTRPEAVTRLDLSGRARNLRAFATSDLRGEFTGRLFADLRDLRASAPFADVRLYGSAARGEDRVTLDVSGEWPRLTGEASATLAALPAPVRLRGDGRGGFELASNGLASGRVQLTARPDSALPDLRGSVRFTPLGLLGAQGSGDVLVSLSGALNRPTLGVSGAFAGVTRSGVRLASLAVVGGGTPDALSLELRQDGRAVASLAGRDVRVDGLTVEALSSTLRVSGRGSLDGTFDGTVRAEGDLAGELSARATPDALTLAGQLTRSGVRADVDVSGTRAGGWRGGFGLSGLPEAVVTRDARFTLGGAFTSPTARGELGLLGADARVDVGTDGLSLALTDGPDTRASGRVALTGGFTDGRWSGGLTLARQGAQVVLGVGGAASRPSVRVDGEVGDLTAGGTVSLGASGRPAGTLTVSDGARSGQIVLAENNIRLDLDRLNLAALALRTEDDERVRGTISALGTYDLTRAEGDVTLTVRDATTGLSVPVVDLPVSGNVDARVARRSGLTTVSGRLVTPETASGGSGRLSFEATLRDVWAGRVTADLSARDADASGSLFADVRFSGRDVTGDVRADAYPLRVMGVRGVLRGTARAADGSFNLDANVTTAPVGRVTLVGGGEIDALLAEFAPGLGVTADADDGYRVDARLDSLDLTTLQLSPYLAGRVAGTATLSDGGSTFVVRSTGLQFAGEELPARAEGSAFGNQWRLRAFLGDSQFVGSLADGVVTGRAELAALPASAVLGLFGGPLPGRGVVTGVARFSVPVSRPLDATADVVAERIRVSAGDETLSGTGTLSYARRELTNVNVQLRGAGEWDVRGEFTRERADLRASFRGTTFTPVLSLVPSVRAQKPELRGDLDVRIGGTYERPEATVTGRELRGRTGDLTFTVPQLTGSLVGGDASASADLTLGGSVVARGRVSASGQLVGGALRGARARYDGDFATVASGRLESVVAEIVQTGGGAAGTPSGWALDGTVVQGGRLRVTGSLAPEVNLTVSARGLAPQLGAIYARETNVDGDLLITERGSDFVVRGGLIFNRLVLGRVRAPDGLARTPEATAGREGGAGFVSPLPRELRTFPPPPGSAPRASPLLSRIVFEDVPVTAPSGIRVDENLARAELTGSLVLSGRASDPRLRGSVRAVRGSLFLRENEFRITTGLATFEGTSAFPEVRAVATGDVPDGNVVVPVTVTVTGTFEEGGSGEGGLRLDTRFSSSAARAGGGTYTEDELYALVAFGTSDVTAIPGNLTQSALRTALNVFLVGEIERNVARALGLDVFRIRTNLLSGESDFSVQFTVGSYLSRNFFVQYQVDLRGAGLLDATYTTDDGRVTFRVSSPVTGLDLSTIRPSLSVAYNLTERSSVSFGVQNNVVSLGPNPGPTGTTFRLGYTFRF